MVEDIRVSVVLASYNGAQYIKAQLTSLLAVLGDRDELVVSDDGSNDGTQAIVLGIADARVRLVPGDARLGYQKNFARAISFARGQYILFSDQDDICLPNRIALSLQALQSKQCVFADAMLVDDVLRPTAISYFASRGAKVFSAVRLFAKPAAIGATMACTREFVMGALPFPSGVPHDQWLSVLAALRGELDVIREPVILYRRHASTASVTGHAIKRPISVVLKERLLLLKALVLWACRRTFRYAP